MTPEEVIVAALEGMEPPIDGVFPAEALKGAGQRFIFYRRLSADEEETLEGGSGLREANFEVNCVAPAYAELHRIASRADRLLQTVQGKTFDGLLVERVKVRQASPDLKEKEVGLYRRVLTLQMNYQEE